MKLTAEKIAAMTLEELDRRIPKSLERLQSVQHELELENKIGSDGLPMSDYDFGKWRDLVTSRLHYQMTEYRRLKEARKKITTSTQDSPVKLLQAAIEILREVEDLSAEELLVCHRIEVWLAARVKLPEPYLVTVQRSAVLAPAPDNAPANHAARKPAVGVSAGREAVEELEPVPNRQ